MEKQIQFEKIKEAVRENLSGKDEVIAAYLYGSFLSTELFGDIDIGLLLDAHFKPPALYEARIAGELEKRTGTKNFDVRLLSNKPPRFLFSVLKNSRLVHSRHNEKRIEFGKKAIREYLDMKPYHDRYNAVRRGRYDRRK